MTLPVPGQGYIVGSCSKMASENSCITETLFRIGLNCIFLFIIYYSYKLFIYFNICILHSNCGFFSLLSFHLPSPPTSTPPPYLFRNGQTSHEYQQNMAYQFAVRQSISSHIQAGKATQYEQQGTKSRQESETAPVSSV